jgi:hypothetical protein
LVKRALRTLDADIMRLQGFVVTAGGAPSAMQRRGLTDAFGGRPCQTAIITGDAVSRGVVTAISWFNPSIRGFAPSAMRAAEDYLALSAQMRVTVRLELQNLVVAVPDAEPYVKQVLRSDGPA